MFSKPSSGKIHVDPSCVSRVSNRVLKRLPTSSHLFEKGLDSSAQSKERAENRSTENRASSEAISLVDGAEVACLAKLVATSPSAVVVLA